MSLHAIGVHMPLLITVRIGDVLLEPGEAAWLLRGAQGEAEVSAAHHHVAVCLVQMELPLP